jgi:hypothetical protein
MSTNGTKEDIVGLAKYRKGSETDNPAYVLGYNDACLWIVDSKSGQGEKDEGYTIRHETALWCLAKFDWCKIRNYGPEYAMNHDPPDEFNKIKKACDDNFQFWGILNRSSGISSKRE